MVERYICNDCGKDFDFGAVKSYTENHGFTDGPFEQLTCCPYCGGDYEEAELCENCGTALFRDESALYAGRWCKDCLSEMVTYDSFIEFMSDDIKRTTKYGSELGFLEEFYFCEIWNFGYESIPRSSTLALKNDLLSLIKASAKMDQIFGRRHFLDKCKEFICLERDTMDAFAEWLDEKEKKDGKEE